MFSLDADDCLPAVAQICVANYERVRPDSRERPLPRLPRYRAVRHLSSMPVGLYSRLRILYQPVESLIVVLECRP
jgi:hypothetical protein